MAPSMDTAEKAKKPSAPVIEAPVASTALSSVESEVSATVNDTLQSQFGNSMVSAALGGADTSPLGLAMASQMESATSGLGGEGLTQAGNAAMSELMNESEGEEQEQEEEKASNPSFVEATRETDTEAHVRHEMAMGLKDGSTTRAVDSSQGPHSSNVPKDGTGRIDGVFVGLSKNGHQQAEEYYQIMKDIGPDGKTARSASEDNVRATGQEHKGSIDGHVHLDDSPNRGAVPETSAAAKPGHDPVLGGSADGMAIGHNLERGPDKPTI